MKLISIIVMVFCLMTYLMLSCRESIKPNGGHEVIKPTEVVEAIKGNTIATRFDPPRDYKRVESSAGSFGAYLQNFKLYPHDRKVYLYNGNLKGNQNVHAAVLDIDVGKRDLQQCADAIMRLWAEYLYHSSRHEKISFDFTNGFEMEYQKWSQGYDISVSGNKVKWVEDHKYKETYEDFRRYLDQVFMYAGTLSLSKQLSTKTLENIDIGDVLIRGGSPGHAVIVVDMAYHVETGEKVFMLAQSYMPAQDIHILKNPNDAAHSPWYFVKASTEMIETPEWTFYPIELKGF